MNVGVILSTAIMVNFNIYVVYVTISAFMTWSGSKLLY